MAERGIFLALLDLPTVAERTAFLDQACAGNTALRARLESLLYAHDTAGSFLGRPARPPAHPDASDTHELGANSFSDDPKAAERNDLSFLAASTRADSLGRIGHYEILQVLGKGGFGIVLRAFDDVLQRVVAIKVLAPHLATTSPARKRFLREARSSARVRHENVVQVYAVEEQPLPYLVMEFIPGESLQQRLDERGPLETAEVLQIGRQIAQGLAAAHATGLIHRDVKPANILIEAGPEPRIKITDFGLARAADDASLTHSGVIAGTPMYMAPEQARGDVLDHRADLFSLGSVLYAICSGRPPFRANSTVAVLRRVVEDTPRLLPDIIPEAPLWLCELIARLHAKNPQDRFASAQEVADLLGQYLQAPGQFKPLPPVAAPPMVEKPVSASTIPNAAPVRGHVRLPRWAVAAAVILALLGTFGVTEATGVTRVGGTVVRLFSPEGTLVVEVDDPGVGVRVDGVDLVITGTGAGEIRLKPGSYTVEARKDGKVVRRELVTVTKNGKQLVRVSQETPAEAKEQIAGAPAADPDRRAAAYVLSVGGMVKINDQNREIRVDADLPPEPFRLTTIALQDKKQVSDAGMASFKDCRNLTVLNLFGTQVGDAGVAHCKDCKRLTELILAFTQVSDAGLAHFKDCKDLKVLNLFDCKVSDAGLVPFKGCTGLTSLDLGRTQVTDAGLANFAGCKGLTILSLLYDTQVTDVGLANFKDCKGLAIVFLALTQVGDAGVAHLKGCKDLRELLLNGTQVGDAGLANFKDCTKLTALVLSGTEVGDAGLVHIKDCRSLTSLQLGKTKVTAAKVAELRQAFPKCKIDWDDGGPEPR